MSELSDWKTFTVGNRFFLWHIPSSSILQVSKDLWQCARGQISPESLDKLQNLSASLSKSYSCAQTPSIKITHIALNVAERCNLRCTYCYAGDGDYGNDSLMSLTTAQKAIRSFANPDYPLHISFFGGEALLNFSLIQDVVNWCSEQKETFRYSLTSNGVLLNEKHLEFFKKHSFHLKVSYDGKSLQTTQRTQNPNLTRNLEDKLLKFEHALHELRSFELRMTLSREGLSSTTQNILDTLTSYNYRVNYARVSSQHPKHQFTQEDVQTLQTLLKQTVTHLLEKEDWDALMRLGNLKTLLRKFQEGEQGPFCGAGLNYLSVSTRGRFYLCHRFTEDEEECLGDLEHGLDPDKVARIVELRSARKEPCSSCWMRKMCQGGCFHEHKMGRGRIDSIDPIFCQLQDTEMQIAFEVYLALKEREARSPSPT